MFKCGDRVIVKNEHGAGQVGIYIGNNYKSHYPNMVMVKLNYNDYYWFTTWVPLKNLYGFVVLCAGAF